MWGEWIEMVYGCDRQRAAVWSLPVWGEWIEISIILVLLSIASSLPVWGEWIEI